MSSTPNIKVVIYDYSPDHTLLSSVGYNHNQEFEIPEREVPSIAATLFGGGFNVMLVHAGNEGGLLSLAACKVVGHDLDVLIFVETKRSRKG